MEQAENEYANINFDFYEINCIPTDSDLRIPQKFTDFK